MVSVSSQAGRGRRLGPVGVCALNKSAPTRHAAVWLSPRCLLCLSPWTCGVRPRPGGLTVDISQLSIKWKNIFYKLNCFKKMI